MYNKSTLIGRLTKDVDLRYTTNGNATCSFTLAVERKMKSSQGEKQTDFLSVVVPPFRGKLAELCANYLERGKLALVEGEIHIRTYEDKDGQKKWITEIEAETVKFLSPRGEQHDNSNATSAIGREVEFDSDVPF